MNNSLHSNKTFFREYTRAGVGFVRNVSQLRLVSKPSSNNNSIFAVLGFKGGPYKRFEEIKCDLS